MKLLRHTLLLLVLIGTTQIYATRMNTAMFYLKKEGNEIKLHMKMDKKDLLASVGAETYTNENSKDIDLAITNYILSNLELKINNQLLSIDLASIAAHKNYFTIEANLGSYTDKIYFVSVKNTCLIEHVGGHSNLIQTRFYDKLRTVKLNKHRTFATIEFMNH